MAESTFAQGNSTRAVALLRSVIPDIALLSDQDSGTARRIAQMLPENERIQWLRYIADPEANTDPTAPLVSAELGIAPPSASRARVNAPYLRYRELGLHLWGLARYAEATDAFQKALPLAEKPVQRGEMYQRIAQAQARMANHSTAMPNALAAEQIWREIAVGPSGKEAKETIDFLAVLYANLDHPRKQVEAVEALAADERFGQFPGRRCYAICKLVELHWSQGHADLAGQIAERAYETYARLNLEPPFEDSCAKLMIRLAYLAARRADIAKAESYLNEMIDGWCKQTTARRWAGKSAKLHKPIVRIAAAKAASRTTQPAAP